MAKTQVAVVGTGRLGQEYLTVYTSAPFGDVEVVGLVEPNADRLATVGTRFGVAAAGQFADTASMLAAVAPEVVVVVTPGKYMHACIMACAAAPSVRAVQCDKPLGASLAEADEMVAALDAAGIIFAGGTLQRAITQVQEVAARLRAGKCGAIAGAAVHGFGNGEISGGGCQHVSVLRLLLDDEVAEVVAFERALTASHDPELLGGAPMATPNDNGRRFAGQFTMASGLVVPFSAPSQEPAEDPSGVDVWSADTLVRWDWGPLKVSHRQ